MSHKTIRLLLFAAFLWATLFARTTFSQEQNNSPVQQSPPAASQSTETTPTSAAAPGTPAPAATTQPLATKRIWTNDDMGGLHRDPSIPNYSAGTKPARTADKSPSAAKNKDAKRYQDQIAALRAKLPTLNNKIAELQGALNGDTVHSTRTYGGNKIDDWHVELADLQKKRDDIEVKVSALQDEARHNGVPENQIPQ